MKKIFIFALVFIYSFNVKAQMFKNYLNDSAIKFTLAIPSSALQNGFFYNSPMRLMQTNVPDSIVNFLLKMKNKDWLDLLSDTSAFYSTTLLLYQINAKDAAIFEIIDNKRSWLQNQKNKDLQYWKTFLKTKRVRIRKLAV